MHRRRIVEFVVVVIGVVLGVVCLLRLHMQAMLALPPPSSSWEDLTVPKKSPAKHFLQIVGLPDDNAQGFSFVELDHCHFPAHEASSFAHWVQASQDQIQTAAHNNTRLLSEFYGQLLEIYATHHGWCDYRQYHPTVPTRIMDDPKVSKVLSTWNQTWSMTKNGRSNKNSTPRVLVSIVAYQDAPQLERLIQALAWPPHHAILIHLEDSSPPEFARKVRHLARKYTKYNVLVIQFGSIVYRTDYISHIQLRLMNWLAKEWNLQFDYWISLGGAVYPLVSPQELSARLVNRSVFLGGLAYQGKHDNTPTIHVNASQVRYVLQNRLLSPLSDKITIRLPRSSLPMLPEESFSWMHKVLLYFTNSGNQAVYHRRVVRAILDHPRAMQLLAMAKYGCCCCLEERVWIAVLHLVGYGQEALTGTPAVFQAWGGSLQEKTTLKNNVCSSSMNNAVLDTNPNACYRLPDASRFEDNPNASLSIPGSLLWHELVQARERGILFARKFHSNSTASMEVLERIQRQWQHSAES